MLCWGSHAARAVLEVPCCACCAEGTVLRALCWRCHAVHVVLVCAGPDAVRPWASLGRVNLRYQIGLAQVGWGI